jgi:hypothetical protein
MTGVTPEIAAAREVQKKTGQRRRRRAYNSTPLVPIVIRIPEALHTELHALLVDPRTGRIRYGTWASTIEQIITDWVNEQKVHSG